MAMVHSSDGAHAAAAQTTLLRVHSGHKVGKKLPPGSASVGEFQSSMHKFKNGH